MVQNDGDDVIWGPDLFQGGGKKGEKRSGDSCSISRCSWNVNQIETCDIQHCREESIRQYSNCIGFYPNSTEAIIH